jgi:hypothetical protein
MIEPKLPTIWKAGNAVLITFRNETVLGLITRASWNAASTKCSFAGFRRRSRLAQLKAAWRGE